MTTPSRPALRYYGGKWRLAAWIISHLPPHTCYVEPFAGAASVLLRKPPAHLEVLNDADGEVVNFFTILRERTDDLIRAIELTPFARAELDLAFRFDTEDPFELARRFYVRSWQSRGGPRTQWRSGWRFQRSYQLRGKAAIDDWNESAHLWQVAARLKMVQIECDDALAIIRRYDSPSTLFYCDPPYLASVREERWSQHAYWHEMSDDDHRELARALNSIRGMAVISGYESELYAELYPGWKTVQHSTQTDAGTLRTECLWISPMAAAHQPQPLLFTWAEHG